MEKKTLLNELYDLKGNSKTRYGTLCTDIDAAYSILDRNNVLRLRPGYIIRITKEDVYTEIFVTKDEVKIICIVNHNGGIFFVPLPHTDVSVQGLPWSGMVVGGAETMPKRFRAFFRHEMAALWGQKKDYLHTNEGSCDFFVLTQVCKHFNKIVDSPASPGLFVRFNIAQPLILSADEDETNYTGEFSRYVTMNMLLGCTVIFQKLMAGQTKSEFFSGLDSFVKEQEGEFKTVTPDRLLAAYTKRYPAALEMIPGVKLQCGNCGHIWGRLQPQNFYRCPNCQHVETTQHDDEILPSVILEPEFFAGEQELLVLSHLHCEGVKVAEIAWSESQESATTYVIDKDGDQWRFNSLLSLTLQPFNLDDFAGYSSLNSISIYAPKGAMNVSSFYGWWGDPPDSVTRSLLTVSQKETIQRWLFGIWIYRDLVKWEEILLLSYVKALAQHETVVGDTTKDKFWKVVNWDSAAEFIKYYAKVTHPTVPSHLFDEIPSATTLRAPLGHKLLEMSEDELRLKRLEEESTSEFVGAPYTMKSGGEHPGQEGNRSLRPGAAGDSDIDQPIPSTIYIDTELVDDSKRGMELIYEALKRRVGTETPVEKFSARKLGGYALYEGEKQPLIIIQNEAFQLPLEAMLERKKLTWIQHCDFGIPLIWLVDAEYSLQLTSSEDLNQVCPAHGIYFVNWATFSDPELLVSTIMGWTGTLQRKSNQQAELELIYRNPFIQGKQWLDYTWSERDLLLLEMRSKFSHVQMVLPLIVTAWMKATVHALEGGLIALGQEPSNEIQIKKIVRNQYTQRISVGECTAADFEAAIEQGKENAKVGKKILFLQRMKLKQWKHDDPLSRFKLQCVGIFVAGLGEANADKITREVLGFLYPSGRVTHPTDLRTPAKNKIPQFFLHL